MSTSAKHKELHAMNVEEPTLKKESLSEKLQVLSQELDSLRTSQSPYSLVRNADMLTQSSFQEKWHNWTSFYEGLQDEIYD